MAEHCPHPPLGWQAGVAPPHSLSPPHARHVWVGVSQIGLDPPHCALVRQGTQLPAAA